MVLLNSCKPPTKSVGVWHIQADHLLSMPINPEPLSHGWIILAVWIESIISALSTVNIKSIFIALCVYLW